MKEKERYKYLIISVLMFGHLKVFAGRSYFLKYFLFKNILKYIFFSFISNISKQ